MLDYKVFMLYLHLVLCIEQYTQIPEIKVLAHINYISCNSHMDLLDYLVSVSGIFVLGFRSFGKQMKVNSSF